MSQMGQKGGLARASTRSRCPQHPLMPGIRLSPNDRRSVPIAAVRRTSNLRDLQPRLRGRDASYLAPPAQIRTCGFPAYGSHLGYQRQFGAVYEPTPVTRLSGSGSGACFAGPHSPWSPPLAPPTPRRSLRFVRRLPSYYGMVRLLVSVHHRLRLLTFPMRTVPLTQHLTARRETSQLPMRSLCT